MTSQGPTPTLIQMSHTRELLLRQLLPSGWKFSLATGSFLSVSVLLINVGVLIWASNAAGDTSSQDVGGFFVLYDAPCDAARALNVLIYIAINIFSSGLVAVRKYNMQCLSAPTRDDVERVHRRGKWLDIGLPSDHNVKEVPEKRAITWLIIMLSSATLHLLSVQSLIRVCFQSPLLTYSINDRYTTQPFSEMLAYYYHMRCSPWKTRRLA